MPAREPSAAELADEEARVATAAFLALLETHDRQTGVRLLIRNENVRADVRAIVEAAGYRFGNSASEDVIRINLEDPLWDSAERVRIPVYTIRDDHRDGFDWYAYGREVLLEKRAGKWTALSVRRTWVE